MECPEFIYVSILGSKEHLQKAIAVDNIASYEPYETHHTRLVLKEVVNGSNVEVFCVEHYGMFEIKLSAV